ncbi:MAG: alpha/beta fold hydrolase [Candidatus Nanopelagicales bacterium]|nr:alpha/beta fold hydrolase [Candidatus Nanopelagicales bacterium]MDZ4249751.1 alpha/beta fold hydrolase [Candidatus Nanopelagicales bacterium]
MPLAMDLAGTTVALAAEPGPRYVSLHDRDIAFRYWPGNGPTVLLIHGLGSSGDEWDLVIPHLRAAGHGVVAIDLPGHGNSARGREDYSLGATASIVRDLMDHLGIDRAILAGHSLGGGIALQFTYQFRERICGLVLVSSGGLGGEATGWLRAATLPGSGLVLAAIGSRATVRSGDWLGRRLRRRGIAPRVLDPDSLAKLASFGHRPTRMAFLATLRSVVDRSGQSVSALGKLTVVGDLPVLLVWGADDPTIPMSHAQNAIARLPHAKLVVFDSVRHEPHRDRPADLAALVVNHFRGWGLDAALSTSIDGMRYDGLL